MKAVEIQNLDQHLKPIQIDGISTPVELSTKGMRISENITFSKDLSIEGDLYVLGSVSDIKMTEGVNLETVSTPGSLAVEAKGIIISSSNYVGDGSNNFDSTLALSADTGYDAKIQFMEGASTHWTIGNDGSESPSLFVISNAGTLGTPELTIDSDGLVTATGDIVAGDDIAVAAEGKLSLDGIGGHTYIAEAADDNVRFVVGGDRMIEFDEGNDRITLEANKLVYELGSGGDEWSVADSAWAGTIIGYRMIGEDNVHETYTLTTSFAVPDSDMTVRFEAPPSGAVEVEVQVYFDGGINSQLLLGLSDNATYNTLGAGYEVTAGQCDETDQQIVTCKWAITGLTAGDTYNYWLGAKKVSGLASNLNWGGTGSGRFCDFTMKVTALPTAVADYAVYD